MSKLEKIVVPSIALVAAVGLALGVLDRVQQPSQAPLRARVTRLSSALQRQRAEIRALQSSTAGLQTATAHAATSQNLSRLQSGLAQLQLCVPQIQQELDGLSVQVNTQNGFVTDAYLTNPTITSANCSRTLNGG